jgi:hypothetical protein
MPDHENIKNKKALMWNLIRADIVYNRSVFLVLYGIIFFAVVLNAVLGDLEEHVSRLMFVSVGFLGLVIGSEELKTKRLRLSVQLPIPIRLNGIMRFPLFSAYWLSLMVMLWISSLISRQGNLGFDYLWFILTKTGLILIVVSGMGISQDVLFCFIRKAPGAILAVLAILCAIGAAFLYFFSTPFEDWPSVTEFLGKTFITPVGALGLLLIGLLFVVLSICVFENRKAYTE